MEFTWARMANSLRDLIGQAVAKRGKTPTPDSVVGEQA
jgi:hypothetical protein